MRVHKEHSDAKGAFPAALTSGRESPLVECNGIGFYVPVEIDVTRLAAAQVTLGLPLRARAELIERDLLAYHGRR